MFLGLPPMVARTQAKVSIFLAAPCDLAVTSAGDGTCFAAEWSFACNGVASVKCHKEHNIKKGY